MARSAASLLAVIVLLAACGESGMLDHGVESDVAVEISSDELDTGDSYDGYGELTLAATVTNTGLIAYSTFYHGDTEGFYIYDRFSRTFLDTPGLDDGDVWKPSRSGDGRYIVYESYYGYNGDGVFLYDREAGSLIPAPGINVAGTERCPDISNNGRWIAYTRGQPGDVFLYDRNTSSNVKLAGLNTTAYNEGCPSVSSSGRFIAFQSNRTGSSDIHLYDRNVSKLIRLPGLNTSWDEIDPSISGDGKRIAFSTNKNTQSWVEDVFVYDRGLKKIVSPTPGLNALGTYGGYDDNHPSLSNDGRYVAFSTARNDLGCEDDGWDCHDFDVLLYDLQKKAFVNIAGTNVAIDGGEVYPSIR